MRSCHRTRIFAALALTGFCSPFAAHAVSVDPDGFGQVLIYPYYNANQSNQTLLSVTNTTDRGKAVKVRFREGVNGRPTIEFNIYLDAQDTWTASVFRLDADGPANIGVSDSTCSVPRIYGNPGMRQLPGTGVFYTPFRNFGYAFTFDDAGPNDLSRTREGFIELIEIGTLRPGTPSSDAVAILANGEPRACLALTTAWTEPGGYWTLNSTQDLDPPSGGMIGNAMIVDVAQGTVYPVRPVALASFRDAPLHAAPGVESPTLADAHDAGNVAIAELTVNGRRVTSTYPATRGIDAVSAVLAAEQEINDFIRDPALGARTDWVMTFPTKQFYADNLRVGAAPVAPFTVTFPREGTPACEHAAFAPLDRSAQGPSRTCSAGVSDPGSCTLPAVDLCSQVEVLTFGATGSPLASLLAAPVPGADQLPASGYARLDLGNTSAESHALRPSNEGHVHRGLPVIGFSATQFVNGQLSGNTLANYSDAPAHRPLRACVEGEARAACD
jgi:hypothetical protein